MSEKVGASAPDGEALSQKPDSPKQYSTAPETQAPEFPAPEFPAPEFPDGIGVSLEDMNVLLTMKHETPMDKGDPALILVSIGNAFLGEIKKLHERHNEALSRIIAGRTQEYVSAVKVATEGFTAAVSAASVEGIRKIFDQQTAALQASVWNARWCALIIAAAALVNLYALAVKP